MRDIRQDVQKRFSRLRSRSAERLSQRNATSERQQNADGQQQQCDSSLDDTYDEEATPTAGKTYCFYIDQRFPTKIMEHLLILLLKESFQVFFSCNKI